MSSSVTNSVMRVNCFQVDIISYIWQPCCSIDLVHTVAAKSIKTPAVSPSDSSVKDPFFAEP